MRLLLGLFFLILGLLWVLALGCGRYGPKPYYEGPKVSSFSGRVVHNGEPVTFGRDNGQVIDFHSLESPTEFGVPLKADGTFSIGWMPTGKHRLVFERFATDGGAGAKFSIPGTFTIEDGKTSGYVIELGKGYKPTMKAPDERPIKKGKG